MTKVDIFINQDGYIHGFQAKGHSGYAVHGEDIVCAAISALTQATVIGLTEVLKLEVEFSRKDQFLSCYLPKDLSTKQREGAQIRYKLCVIVGSHLQRL